MNLQNAGLSNYPQAMLMADFYKLSHREQYPPGTQVVYSTWTPRASRIDGLREVVVFGAQGFVQEYLLDFFSTNFFSLPIEKIISDYVRTIRHTLGVQNPSTQHIADLHKLGYLPLEIKSLAEGTIVPLRVPTLTIRNTDPRFFWLTNYLETLMSLVLWKPSTSATIANQYRMLLESYAVKTVGNADFVPFQGHDFSMRGMDSVDSACRSGAGHLLSFVGTDTVPAIGYLEKYYGANIEKELVGTSIPATEHSVMCAYGDDRDSFKRLVTEIYPSGFISIVSDTWDLWEVLTEILPSLKKEIMARDGKVVIRPDSGDPVKIVCGDPASSNPAERKGVVELLWDIFGGSLSEQGYKVLDPHIGCIYGDSISLERCEAICSGLAKKRFASTNMVYGIGSFTYQYTTRDTFGYALKSTLCVINGVEKHIFKDPKTDDGTKRSQKGRVRVQNTKPISYVDQLSLKDQGEDLLETIFLDGQAINQQSLAEIRARIRSHTAIAH
jgi:nicotinamide phosphoribosyltransferase